MDRNKPEYWIHKLNLEKHPEGGYYRETHRSERLIDGRNLTTNIYYLLPASVLSHFHRLKYDEYWYFHLGSALSLHCFFQDGSYIQYQLGNNPDKGQRLSLTIPGGTIFGGEVADKDGFVLVSCNMTPGFHFEDFEMIEQHELMDKYPAYRHIIEKFYI